MYYVYTKKAEDVTKQLGLDTRYEGALAYFGHTPLHLCGNDIKVSWVIGGWVKSVEEEVK